MNAPAIILPTALPDTLARILEDKRAEVTARMAAHPMAEMERAARDAEPTRDFVGALCTAVSEGSTGLIAEIKRKSPSGGLIRPDFDPAAIARDTLKTASAREAAETLSRHGIKPIAGASTPAGSGKPEPQTLAQYREMKPWEAKSFFASGGTLAD